MGLTAATGSRGLTQRFANAGHGENRPDAGDRVARRENNGLRRLDALDDAGSWAGLFRAFEAHGTDLNLMALAHEVFLKVQFAVDGVEHGGDAVVGHGQHEFANSHSAGEFHGYRAQGPARPQQVRAGEMGRQIEVAKTEPRRLPQFRHAFKAAKTFVLQAPAALWAERAGEGVQHRIDVGRNVQPPPLDVVASVDDNGQVFRSDGVLQTLNELCAAGATGENDDHLGSPHITMVIGGGEQAAGQQSAAIDDSVHEFGIHRKPLTELLSGGLGAAL